MQNLSVFFPLWIPNVISMAKTKILTSESEKSALSLLDRELKKKAFAGARYFILTDEKVSESCLSLLVSEVEPLQESEFFEVESGEQCKDISVVQNLWLSLLESSADRNAVIVNLGGGSVCDLGGFVAATYKRGIRHVNVPTTLLAMCDASIGGKTAVNFAGIKNMVGCFYNPVAVCIEPAFLDTLPEKDFLSGFFEMLKTAMLTDAAKYGKLLRQLQDGSLQISGDDIKFCALAKQGIADRDFTDLGVRRILNFGHTFGHAIESFSMAHCGNQLSHGQAVALGMLCEARLSVERLGFPESDYSDLSSALKKAVCVPEYSSDDIRELISYMYADKKNSGGKIKCVLMSSVANPQADVEISEKEIEKIFTDF